ncbi:ExeA family protein [Vibrio algivorus]|uniref:General secretion pathway protein GspA n=1 Tax=Vibrio algivorus TaxID=1667024 RepID=A0ABQ6EPP5_9VIBR|nr:ExeA family protein [Vibrio algivorus]GLT15115.1 general secretion pathway protein GspA [Vibrio algivorus]
MYKDFFGLSELPFTIVPSSRYIFLSARHREAMNHLQAGLGGGGGFALLTGEVGTGKTTVSKALLSVLESNVKTGLLLNPTYTSTDLLEAICDEFSISYQQSASLKQLTQAIYQYLLDNHGKGIKTLLLIDEAQHLSADVLEQLRLLTNLETESQKLLRVLLIGQPELQYKLQTEELRQLAQRITGRYHLLPLTTDEVSQYIQFRLQVAGGQYDIFTAKAIKLIAKQTQGVPRLINLVCDKCMLYAYYGGEAHISLSVAEKACEDVMSFQCPIGRSNPVLNGGTESTTQSQPWLAYFVSLSVGCLLAATAWFWVPSWMVSEKLESASFESVAEPISAQVNQTAPNNNDLSSQNNNIAELVEPLIRQSYNPISAMKTLMALWGYKVANDEANCQQVERANLYCYQDSGTLNDLAVINRPAMLTLQDQYHSYFAILYKLSDEKVQLLLADKRVEVPTQWLKQHWSGEFQLLWHSELAGQTLKLSSQGPEVEKLNNLLSQVLGEPLKERHQFDQSMKNRVEAFQMWQGINVDGIAGKRTLMLLDSYVNNKAPSVVDSILPLATEDK